MTKMERDDKVDQMARFFQEEHVQTVWWWEPEWKADRVQVKTNGLNMDVIRMIVKRVLDCWCGDVSVHWKADRVELVA